MPKFKYSAIDLENKPLSGEIVADSEQEAMGRLRGTVRLVSAIAPVRESSGDIDVGKFFGSGMVADKPLAMLCSQLSIILSAGLPVLRAVELVAAQTEDKQLRQILEDASEDMSAGHTMADSFDRAAKGALPVTFTETVRAGEAGGSLTEAFARLHKYFDKSAKTKGKVQGALTYPLFVIGVAIIVVIVIMTVAVPMFRTSFASMGTQLPLPTRILIAISDFFVNDWYILLLIGLGAFLGITLYKKSDAGRIPWAKFQLKLPVLGKLRLMRCCGELSGTLSTLLAAGLPIVDSLRITSRTVDNALMGSLLEKAAAGVEEGRQLAACLRQTHGLPTLLTEMIGVGEESGELEKTLDVVGEYYDNEAETMSAKAVSMLEPIIIVFLAVVVMLVLLAVYLPMFSMYDSI